MRQLQNAVAVFCTACICAELVCLLSGSARIRQCIKAAAGLYILVSLIHALPALRVQAGLFELPSVPTADFGSTEQAILEQAERQLEQTLEQKLLQQTGWSIRLDLTLMQTVDGVRAVQAAAELPPGCPDEVRQQAQEILCQELEMEKIQFVQKEGEG